MRILVALAALASCQAGSAFAGAISSTYTDLDWKADCVTYAQAAEGEGDWADLACSGYRGYPVMIAYDDARESVYYGFPAADMTGFWESFVAFNGSSGKVEWRVETNGDSAIPFAAIHRRSVNSGDDGAAKTDVLVVSKVGQPGGAAGCTVGLVAASGNPQANDEARRIADEKAKAFECGKDRRLTSGAVPAFGRVDN
ncbi:MAG: hypothetical protein J0I98_13565 [Mesorhizobium sp.]|nr:hypothetical protein [Mesorhizobium sp.]MBN9243813.1 hypothetical protein [Mesorhizobium sp.]MBN9275551.1 hypothetical protein [Mesorhizobium sp.]